MKSKIILAESVLNEDRKFGSQLEYFPCEIKYNNDNVAPALFTESQIVEATERAARNLEDVPEDKTFWDFLF